MMLRYAHLSPADLREAVEAIGAVENSNRLRAGCASTEKAEAGNASKVLAGEVVAPTGLEPVPRP
jgi:hypothetical protein